MKKSSSGGAIHEEPGFTALPWSDVGSVCCGARLVACIEPAVEPGMGVVPSNRMRAPPVRSVDAMGHAELFNTVHVTVGLNECAVT